MMYDLWNVPATFIALFPLLDFRRVKCDTFLPLQKLYDITGSVPTILFLVDFSCNYRLNTFLLARDLHWILTLSVHASFLVFCIDGTGCNALFIFLFLHLFLHLNLHDFVQLADQSDVSSHQTRVDAALLLELANQVALCALLRRTMRSHLSTRALAHAATSSWGAPGFQWGFPSTLSWRELIPGLIVHAWVTLSVLRTEHLHNFDSINLRGRNRS